MKCLVIYFYWCNHQMFFIQMRISSYHLKYFTLSGYLPLGTWNFAHGWAWIVSSCYRDRHHCVDAKRGGNNTNKLTDSRQETVCIVTPVSAFSALFLLIKTFKPPSIWVRDVFGTRQQNNCLITAGESGEWGSGSDHELQSPIAASQGSEETKEQTWAQTWIL